MNQYNEFERQTIKNKEEIEKLIEILEEHKILIVQLQTAVMQIQYIIKKLEVNE